MISGAKSDVALKNHPGNYMFKNFKFKMIISCNKYCDIYIDLTGYKNITPSYKYRFSSKFLFSGSNLLSLRLFFSAFSKWSTGKAFPTVFLSRQITAFINRGFSGKARIVVKVSLLHRLWWVKHFRFVELSLRRYFKLPNILNTLSKILIKMIKF